MSGLTVWWDAVADGAVNMAADELLAAEAVRRGEPLVRFYGWTSPTVSLGAFQRIDEARAIPAIAAATIVRRPSGGGALVHGSDLTYALAAPKSHPWGRAAQPLYDAVHTALAEVLGDRGIRARLHAAAAGGGPDERGEAFFCFSRRAGGDLVAALPGRPPAATDPKIMGSAQRRLAGVVIQHGSLLLTANLAVGEPARHPGLAEIGAAITAPEVRPLARDWMERLAGGMGIRVEWEAAEFRAGRETDVSSATERFLDARWTARR